MNVPATPEHVRVLVVEHEPEGARLAIEALESSTVDYDLTVVGDAASALNHLHATGRSGPRPRPDLIFLDLGLPGGTGHVVLADLKADDRLRTIPVIALTCPAKQAETQGAYDVQSCCHIKKPANLDEFVSVVHAIEQLWLPTVLRGQQEESSSGRTPGM